MNREEILRRAIRYHGQFYRQAEAVENLCAAAIALTGAMRAHLTPGADHMGLGVALARARLSLEMVSMIHGPLDDCEADALAEIDADLPRPEEFPSERSLDLADMAKTILTAGHRRFPAPEEGEM